MTWQIPVFGVRHLSPMGAWQLRAFLERTRPDLVLIEGLDETAVRHALWHLRSTQKFQPAMIDALPLYRLFFSLLKRPLAT